jgi:hypothetical protein
MDYASIILNQGLYQMRTINTVPGWIANEGESLLYSSGGKRRCYYYIDGGWRYIQWSSATGSSVSTLMDSDEDTVINVEESADEDIIRFDTGGTERLTIGTTGNVNVITGDLYATAGDIYATVGDIAVASGSKIMLEGIAGDTYLKYNTNLLELYVDNTKLVTVDTDQFGVESGIKLGLEGNAGDTYWKYNSVSTYLEGWVDGTKRIEL